MFQMTVGRSAVGLSLAVCIVWVSWTQGHQNQGNHSESNLTNDAIVLPTGFLPTKPLSSTRPNVVGLSAENLAAYSDGPGAAQDFLALFNFYALSAPQDPYGALVAKSVANASFGNNPEQSPRTSDRAQAPFNQDLAQAAADLFSTPFNALFYSAFGKSASEAAGALPNGEGDQNPFTKAKQESETADSSTPSEFPDQNGNTDDDASRQSSRDALQASGNAEARFLFLGDWDGSGILQSAVAARINDATFAFTDGQRTFDLTINPTVVEHQRSLALEDIDGDAIPDLLITGRDSLSGGVFRGDAAGTFALTDAFITGYEPMLAAVGPFRGGKREIITFNTRSGAVATFRASDRFMMVKKQSLDFAPDFIGHLIEQNQGTDHLMAAKLGQAARTYQILDDDTLFQSVDSLPSRPSLSINRDFLGKGGPQGLLQIFQTGPYASLVLSNASGETYNVANLRVFPRIFIVVGDLNNDDTVDVAVALLK